MRITYCSDLHLEFGALNRPMPSGDVLVLAGDITLLGIFDPDSQLYKHARFTERTMTLLEQLGERFERMFYLIGNHESYNSDLSKAPRIIRSKLKSVTLLNDKWVDLGRKVLLVGGTLWTDMNKGRDAFVVGQSMNDFRCIHVEDKEGTRMPGVYQARAFRPQDAMARFERTRRFIGRIAKTNPDKTIVVATHHAPSEQGLQREHVHNSRINAGYYTNLETFIAEHPNIEHWIHGHTHLQKAYRIAQCQVVSNARGYIGREHSADVFDPDCWFDPVTGERKDPKDMYAEEGALDAVE